MIVRVAKTFIILLLSLPLFARAADYCVDTGAELASALSGAAASDEDDVIRLESGAVTLPGAITINSIHGGLSVIGGYSANCVLIASLSSFSTVIAAPGTSLYLGLGDGDLSTLRLNFTGFTAVTFSDQSYGTAVVAGEIRVQRSAFVGNGTGLSIVTNHHDVRVENSLFVGSTLNDGNIYAGSGLALSASSISTADISVQVINNTASNNRHGFTMVSTKPSLVPVLGNNIAYFNRSSDIVLRQPTRIEYSVWETDDFAFGGGLAAGSGNNSNSDPELDANYKPSEPGSPVINNGDNTPVGGLPSSDYDGGKRLVGTRVDRGAYESAVNNSPVLTVTSAANSGTGTLRQAILDGNTSPGAKTIEFDIPGDCPHLITLTTALPALVEPVTIAGYSQPDSAQNDHPRAFNGKICVALLGGGAIATGLDLQTATEDAMTVEGLAFFGFTSEALKISGTGSGFVRGNGFGTFGTSAVVFSAGLDDAAIRVQNAPGSEIGGADVAARNVIARAAGAGIRLEASDDGRFVQNNLIGPPTGGNLAFRNGIGITVVGSFRDVITKNLIDNSVTQGVRILASATPAQQTTISDNDIGISPAFNDAGNGTNGIRIEGGSGHSVVFNKIVNNGTDGLVVLTASRKVRFANNSIANNALQAIDLSPDGVNPIDLDVDATGANDQQNYPTLTYAGGTSDAGTVSGLLESANGTYLIQFFRSSTCDANGYGEAETWIGQTSATISNAGPFSNGGMGFTGDVVSPSGSNIGAYITAIATDEEGNSSEVSACTIYREAAIFANGFE